MICCYGPYNKQIHEVTYSNSTLSFLTFLGFGRGVVVFYGVSFLRWNWNSIGRNTVEFHPAHFGTPNFCEVPMDSTPWEFLWNSKWGVEFQWKVSQTPVQPSRMEFWLVWQKSDIQEVFHVSIVILSQWTSPCTFSLFVLKKIPRSTMESALWK